MINESNEWDAIHQRCETMIVERAKATWAADLPDTVNMIIKSYGLSIEDNKVLKPVVWESVYGATRKLSGAAGSMAGTKVFSAVAGTVKKLGVKAAFGHARSLAAGAVKPALTNPYVAAAALVTVGVTVGGYRYGSSQFMKITRAVNEECRRIAMARSIPTAPN